MAAENWLTWDPPPSQERLAGLVAADDASHSGAHDETNLCASVERAQPHLKLAIALVASRRGTFHVGFHAGI